ncbi:MAG: VCBS repeat-containing protein, partial [Saprospiraceae bacterium]|nr:VCBS repeat-containing protein [Saprospiraceae bacterium]
MKKLLLFPLAIFILLTCNQRVDVENQTDSEFEIFKKVSPEQSGVDFSNALTADVATKENLLDYDYFYNGSGVAACDLDNDGLPELFFAANQKENRLYHNLGNLKFDDISDKAGINVGKSWANGVTFADINRDGWLDIYVSQGGPHPPDQRKNLLYINQQDLTFKEMALEYGLDDAGISTQSAFFDYDLDNDLDCFVMNESELYGFDPLTFQKLITQDPAKYQVSFSHLYENQNGTYVDISQKAGITKPTFGLGLSIADINADGWLDIYIANDYYLPDNLYINKKDGSFADRAQIHLGQMSFFGMGIDVADLNNDLLQDIIVLDMASKDHVRSKTLMASMNVQNFSLLVDQLQYPHQYMFNTVQLNNGQGRFNNVAHYAGLAKTDWSWAALAADFDLDGHKDVFVSNGYRRYALDNDFKRRVTEVKQAYPNNVPIGVKEELYYSMPSEALPNVVYKNLGDMNFSDATDHWGLGEPTFSNGAAAVDLDLDGDLDLVINNIDQPAGIYQNLAADRNTGHFVAIYINELQHGLHARVTIFTGAKKQFVETRRTRGYRSSMPAQAHFGLGDFSLIDSLKIEFSDGRSIVKRRIKADQVLGYSYEESEPVPVQGPVVKSRSLLPYTTAGFKLDFRHQEDIYNDFGKEVLLPQKQSTFGPCLSVADVNGDGQDDLFAGGASGQAGSLYLQTPDGSFILSKQPAFEKDKICEDLESVFFDLDGDSDLDLITVSGGNSFPAGHPAYQHRLYLNDGMGYFVRQAMPDLDQHRYSGKAIKAFDFDGDGDKDILIGNRIMPQSYPIAAPSFLLENQNGKLVDVTSDRAAALSELGIINDMVIADINADQALDFIVVGEWTGVHVFVNDAGSFQTLDIHNHLHDLTGWWFSIHETDVNRDGNPDFLIGNVGTNIKHRASVEKPFKVFANDFDNNGTLDIVLSNEYQGNYVPARGRECSSQQMPIIAEKFTSYVAFASATIEDVYGEENLEGAYSRSVVTFESILLVSDEAGQFTLETLPWQSQLFPLLDAVITDVNSDGIEDAIVAGCIYETEVETPRLDAGHGLILLGNGAGRFTAGS